MASLLTSSTLSLHNLNQSYLSKQGFHPNPSIRPCSPPSSHQSKLFLRHSKRQFNPNFRPSASASSSLLPPPFPRISDSTRSIASIFAAALWISNLFAKTIHGVSFKFKGLCKTPSPEELAALGKLQRNLLCSTGPLFFAAMAPGGGQLSTPLTIVAAGMAKWLDIYSGVLLIRVLLSWFPNIPWDRQPLSAIRDLCDPYLNLFRNVIPPLFDTLDVSPLLAFAVLGTFSAVLNHTRGSI